MGERIQIPDIPEGARTPLVKGLVDVIEWLVQKVRQQEEQIAQLQDEIAVLKGEKKRPRFQPSQLDKRAGRKEGTVGEDKRPGSEKRSKTASLVIHEDKVIAPAEPVPEGSRFKGYRDFVVQDLVIRAHNTRYHLERWETPDGRILIGELPVAVGSGHFGVTLVSYILYQHHHCQVTQPLLLEQLHEWGIDISAGQIDALLTGRHEPFHEEKEALLPAAFASAGYLTVDDTGARHRGQNGYTTHMGNEWFAWFGSTKSKSRINFLQLLRAGHEDYRVDTEALAYMQAQKLPHGPLERLRTHSEWLFADEAHWSAHLTRLGITQERHRRIATEGALLGSVLHHGFPKELPIVSDDAGQFKVLCHGRCWVHAERLIHTLVPLNPTHRRELAEVRGQLWELYADLKAYKEHPSPEKNRTGRACPRLDLGSPAFMRYRKKIDLEARFDALFTTQTSFETLNQTLRRIHRDKAELLLVLDRPDMVLHTNGSEQDLRDAVKKRKVSGGTRSDLGRRCRDTFMSLKRTCRKLGVSFWQYLTDRLSHTYAIPPLPGLIQQRAALNQ